MAGLLDGLPADCARLIVTWRAQGYSDGAIVADIAKREAEREDIRRLLALMDAENAEFAPPPDARFFRIAPGRLLLNQTTRPELELILIVLDRIAARRTAAETEQRAIGDAIEAALTAEREPPDGRRGRRGPRPTKRDAMVAAMLADLSEGRLTAVQLERMTEEALTTYGGSRDTGRKARDLALSQFQQRQKPTIDK
jgi:hypothetical protein